MAKAKRHALRKGVGYAYPTSARAKELGVSRTGGYYIFQERLREDGTWSPSFVAQGHDVFADIKDADLWKLLDETEGTLSPYSMKPRATNPDKRHSAKWDRCVKDVRRKGTVAVPEAVCTKALKRRKNPASGWYAVVAQTVRGTAYYAGITTNSDNARFSYRRTDALGFQSLKSAQITADRFKGWRTGTGERWYFEVIPL